MTYLILLCLANAVFSSIPPSNERLESYIHSIKRSIDLKENKKENLSSLKDLNDSYQDQIQDGFRKRDKERRIFDWINNIITTNDSDKTLDRAKELKNEDTADVTTNFRDIERNLTVTLTKLSHVLTQILNIVKYTRQGHFKSLNHVIKSSIYNKNRYKRELNETVENDNDNLNKTNDVEKGKDVEENKELEKDGRRTMQGNPFVSNEVKERLLHYINEGFDEIKNRIESLRQLKNMFSNNVNYKIGYIVANLDSLDANMRKLNEHLNVNQRILNDTKILSLYDTVKSSTTAVRNLMDVLKKYLDSNVN
ncbi:asparagine-rich protein-like [Vanessa cardui]|uniref:asparagine-rich protein-like n=1 Tax=Vanessa cardui TaxID=171605 RepID=UPI001F136AFB|nr:asparagine-rich protein-like [Vanessa cardui]